MFAQNRTESIRPLSAFPFAINVLTTASTVSPFESMDISNSCVAFVRKCFGFLLHFIIIFLTHRQRESVGYQNEKQCFQRQNPAQFVVTLKSDIWNLLAGQLIALQWKSSFVLDLKVNRFRLSRYRLHYKKSTTLVQPEIRNQRVEQFEGFVVAKQIWIITDSHIDHWKKNSC